MSHGHFDDEARSYVVTDPLPPRPWINYLGNRRLSAFVSQNAGGLLWHKEPYSRRISRYHYTAAPGDRPGFYVYLRDRDTGTVWNPHFAPSCEPLDRFECRHEPGLTTFRSEKDGLRATVAFGIPPEDDVMLWRLSVENLADAPRRAQACSYLEFGLLEFMREVIGWCYLKNQFSLRYDAATRAIRYDYHVFEAPDSPAMAFGCTETPSGFDCSRDAFIGRAGSLERPEALREGHEATGSELPLGGHACAALAVDMELAPGAAKEMAYRFALAPEWNGVDALLDKYGTVQAVDEGLAAIRHFYASRLGRMQVECNDAEAARIINTWTPYNSLVTCQLARTVSTDHMGMDGLRYRDTMQDALAVAHLDPGYARERMRLVFAEQTADGGGCFAFYPDTDRPTTDAPHRCDNTVWPVYTVNAYLAETGDTAFLDETIPFRDQGDATVYEHVRRGLAHIHERRGPHGLPTLYHADWNDGLALFQDEAAESVMLAQQLVYSCREFRPLAEARGDDATAAWCRSVEEELTGILNSDDVWDGAWYRRLLLSNGDVVGGQARRQGQIYLNPQSWAVLSGVGDRDDRGRIAMDAAAERLDTDVGLRILTPPFAGFPEPEDPPLGSNPGVGENGGIFCHANTWAVIAECLLGRGDRAWKYYRQLLPESVIAKVGGDHYEREPYVYVSSIVGPPSDRFGQGGISWLTGTASWMYIAATQYILGVRPTLGGLRLRPCLPASLERVRVTRRFRDCLYDIEILNEGRGAPAIELDGSTLDGDCLPLPERDRSRVVCRC